LIKIAIISPAAAIRAGLKALLSEDPQINIVGEAAELNELTERQSEADVLVWSPGFTNDQSNAVDELQEFHGHETEALLLVYNDPKVVDLLNQMKVRAWGLLDPESTQTELIAGVHALKEGLSVSNAIWMNQILTTPKTGEHRKNGLVESLTEREVEILQLLALGLTNKQIAARLKISSNTVKFHVSSIFGKLGTTNRVEAVNLGLKNGLIVL